MFVRNQIRVLKGLGDVYSVYGGGGYAPGSPQTVSYQAPGSPLVPLALIGAALVATFGAVFWWARK